MQERSEKLGEGTLYRKVVESLMYLHIVTQPLQSYQFNSNQSISNIRVL